MALPLPRRSPLEAFPLSIALLGTCVILYAVTDLPLIGGKPNDALKDWGINSQVGVWNGEWWRPLTAMFLHGNLMHLFMNGYALWQLCPALERDLGTWRFSIVYFGAGLASSFSSLAFEHASLGASGAICGIMATYIRFERIRLGSFRGVMRDRYASQFVIWLGLTIALGFLVPGISNAGHIGGTVGGWMFGAAVWPALRGQDRGRVARRPSAIRLAGTLVLLAAAAVFVSRPLPNSPESWVEVGLRKAKSGDTAGALEAISKARGAKVDDEGVYYFYRGHAEDQAERWATAQALYELSMEAGLRDPAVWHNLARMYEKTKDDAKLLAHLRKWKVAEKELDEEWEEKLGYLEAREKKRDREK